MVIIFDPTKNKIELDMDGVLADFDKFVLDNMGRTFNHSDGPPDKEMWDFLASVDQMYLQLEPTPYCFELVDLARSLCSRVEILTAIPRRAAMASAESDKREWVSKYLGNDIHVKIGPYSRDKWKHANPGDILVDDRQDNIQQWINQGSGIGIFHEYENYPRTAERLKAMATEYLNFR